MFISRMALNVARPGAAALVASPYKMHAAVSAAFPPGTEASGGRVLWRLDASSQVSEGVWLYVVSPTRPDLTHVVEQAGWPTTTGWETKDYAPVLDGLAEGQSWRFRLKANPVRKVSQDRGREPNERVVGSIQGHVTESQQRDWLLARAEGKGFRVPTGPDGGVLVRVSHRTKETFMRAGSRVTLSTCVFDGLLEVTDPVAFRATLCEGMGRAKGFGCGLITVSPLRRDV